MPSSDASDELLQLRTELAVARDLAEKAQANALNAEAEAARVRAINANLLARNAHLEMMNEKMRRDKYGASSERSRRLIDQLELTSEELEADAAEAESLGAIAAAKATTVTAFTRVRSTRRDFDPGLPREQVVIPARELCPCCGSADLSHLPADITETLEKVPARHKVIQTMREGSLAVGARRSASHRRRSTSPRGVCSGRTFWPVWSFRNTVCTRRSTVSAIASRARASP
jgi:transposase